MKSFSYFFIILIEVFVLFAMTSVAANQLQFKNGVYNLTWNYLPASQEIEFEVRVKTTGYVALGLTKTNSSMKGLDLFVGGVKNGAGFLKDYYANGEGAPDVNEQQDFTLISATESNGITMVRCKRKLNTQDVNDLLIQAGDKVYFAWAYHGSSDDLHFHDYFGYSLQMHELVPLPTTALPTTVAVTTPPSSSQMHELVPLPTTAPPTTVAVTTPPSVVITTSVPFTPTTTKMTPTTSAAMTSYSVVLLTLAVCVALVSH